MTAVLASVQTTADTAPTLDAGTLLFMLAAAVILVVVVSGICGHLFDRNRGDAEQAVPQLTDDLKDAA